MVYLLLVVMGLLTLTTLAAAMAAGGSPSRKSFVHPLTCFVFSAYVVGYAAVANSDVLDRLFYTQDLERASPVPLVGIFDDSVFVPRAGDDPLYVGLLWLLSRFGTSTVVFFSGVAIVCLIVYIFPLTKVLASWQLAFVLIVTVALGPFTSYTSIVARQGIAMSLIFAGLIMAAALNRLLLCLFLMGLGCLFHWSALPFALIAILVCWIRPRLRVVLISWGAMAVLFLAKAQESVMGPLTAFIPKYGNYTSAELASVYVGGTNRLDFFAVSLAMGIVFLFFERKLDLPEWYSLLVKAYWGMNALFLLMGYVYYSDRLAAFSWFLAPILLAAPVYAAESSRARNISALVLLSAIVIAFTIGPLHGLTTAL